MTKSELVAQLTERFQGLRGNDLELLLTSGFAMGAGPIAYRTNDGLCLVSQRAIDNMEQGDTRAGKLAWTQSCPLTSDHDMQNPAQRGGFYNAACV